MLIQVTNEDVMYSGYLKKEIPIVVDGELDHCEKNVLILRFRNENKFNKIVKYYLTKKRLDLVKVSSKKPGYRHYQNVDIVYYNEELKQIWIDFVLETTLSLHELRKLKIKNILDGL